MDLLLEQRFPALRGIDDPVGREILANARLLQVPPQQILFHVGDSCDNYLLVVQGQVKVLGRSPEGREIVLYRIEDCGTCVLTTSCLLSQQCYPAEGVSETEVMAFAIPRERFQQALTESPGLRRFIFDSYGQRLSALIGLVQEIAFQRIDLRLARYLVNHGTDRIELAVTHQDLATELGSAREVISRQLKQFERQGWISLGRGHIRIENLKALQCFAASELI